MSKDEQSMISRAAQDASAKGTVLVFGTTGQQGGAVARALNSRGWPVRAFVRNLNGEKAKALAASGIELVKGDFSDLYSMKRAMAGVYGVFSIQPSSGQGSVYGVTDDDEVGYGIAIADLAVQAGVQHFIYTSANASGDGKTGMGHFDSKSEIEAYIRRSGLKVSIVRPAAFMELLMLPGMGLDTGIFTFFLRPGQSAQVIAVDDIGKIVAAIFSAPEQFVGKTLEIAGDSLTSSVVVAI
ncbi:NmrA/HSCARG family protein [Herbaspirillum sp. RV1423]|uniref:NmrA/HSCARG family protein n=1 Tax=Herbaspirillum sp. RV1423 TaxID=1443993 RepID=UPI00068667BD|nr:NmrA/HSCARG family protein [Herbaspirillum sp. RV1423]